MQGSVSHIIRFVFLVLLQGLVLNNIDLFGYSNPYVYILFLLLLPQDASPSAVLVISFFLGLCVDMFTLTWGMHTAASVFVAFIRPYLLRLLAPRDGFSAGTIPGLSQMGINWFLAYAFIITLLHHLFLSYVEVFRWAEFFTTFFRAFVSTIFTLVLLLLFEFLTYKPVRNL